jgi:hypothetical protein
VEDTEPRKSLAELFAQFSSREAIEKHIQFCNSYTRLPTLLDIATFCDADDWLAVLGDAWEICDNISEWRDELLDESPLSWADYPVRAMMRPEENEQFDALPDEVIMYRGCYQQNKRGLSWTLDRAVAERFPFYLRYQQKGPPLLVKGRAKKADIIAFKGGREEAEIIAERVKIISTSHIKVKA